MKPKKEQFRQRYAGPFIGAALAVVFFLASAPAWAQAPERLTVYVSLAKIRSGPGTGYEWIWKVARYHPVEVLESSGAWYRIRDFEGDQGWLLKKQVKKIPAVITKKPRCNVRKGPGMKNDKLFTVGKGIPFKKLTTKGDWIQVEHDDGDRGWIHKSLVW